MMLVDTSVAIDYANGRDAKLSALLPTLAVAVCGVTRAELLCGGRDPADRQDLLNILAGFHQLPIPETLWNAVGDNLAALRAVGIAVPFADVVIATVAIANDIELWTRDKHFALMQAALPALKLFQEPP
jgi:predicted nucleic acid-binding protein